MAEEMKFSAGISLLGSSVDRFISSGYKEPKTIMEMLNESKRIIGIQGIELGQGMHIDESNVDEVKQKLKELNYLPSLIMSDTFCQRKFAKGQVQDPHQNQGKRLHQNL